MSYGLLLSAATFIGMLAIVLPGTACSHFPPGRMGLAPPVELAHRLRTDVRHLAGEIGERNLYHPEKLAAAADWIEAEFKRMGY